MPIAQLNTDGTIKEVFGYGLHRNVPDLIVKSGTTYRVLTDQLGSVRLVVDTSGNVMQQLAYDEWGNVTTDTNPGFQPFGFGGGLYDRDTGFVRFGLRDYDPATGQWVSKDPSRFGGGLNLYAYCENDPVNCVDVTGEWGVFGWGSIGVDTPGPVRAGGEAIAVSGLDTKSGAYVGDILAGGVQVGGVQNYLALYGGEEATTDGCPTSILLGEAAVGPELPFLAGIGGVAGFYRQGTGDWGVYAGAHEGAIGEHGALGFGVAFPRGWSDWLNRKVRLGK